MRKTRFTAGKRKCICEIRVEMMMTRREGERERRREGRREDGWGEEGEGAGAVSDDTSFSRTAQTDNQPGRRTDSLTDTQTHRNPTRPRNRHRPLNYHHRTPVAVLHSQGLTMNNTHTSSLKTGRAIT